MTQGERVKVIRKKAQLTMEQFGDRIGNVSKSTISNIENGNRNLTDLMLRAICSEFNVNEEWLRTGNGDMPQKLSEDEEVADLVSDILEDGKDNSFYSIILEIIQIYKELSPSSQEALREFSRKLAENLSKKKED